MEKVNRKEKSLKVEFSVAIAFTLILVVAASAATIYCCYRLQKYLLPDPNAVILHAKVTMPNGDVREVDKEYRLGDTESPLGWLQIVGAETPDLGEADFSVESVEASFSSLRPKKKLLYRAAGISMVGLPLLYSILGTIGCAWWFYRNKLAPAIQVLDEAVQHISDQDLDFTVACKSKNELGRLCGSFEKMRQALYENNLQMWRTIEERRTMQASVAHDLRNPLFTVASIYYPQFQPDMVQSSSYGMYHDALTGIYQIHFSENTPADSSYSAADNALAALSNVSVDSELMDSEFIQTRLGGLNFVSDQETTENLLDANVYSYVSYNGKTVYSNLDISEQETVHVVYQLCGIPGAEYKISFYANHRLLSDGENNSWEVKLEKGAVVTLEADVRTDQLGDLTTFYAIACPAGANARDLFLTKTSSILFYQ